MEVIIGILLMSTLAGFVAGLVFSKLILTEAHSLEMRANEAFAAMGEDIHAAHHRLDILEQRADGAIKIVQGHGTA